MWIFLLAREEEIDCHATSFGNRTWALFCFWAWTVRLILACTSISRHFQLRSKCNFDKIRDHFANHPK